MGNHTLNREPKGTFKLLAFTAGEWHIQRNSPRHIANRVDLPGNMAPSRQSLRLRPRDIRFTQDSIGSRFTDGRYLSDTFEELLNRRISVDQLEWIEVVEERSLYWALTGNRRLYLYRKLEDLGEVNTIPVREMSLSDYGVMRRFDNRNTTSCDGLDIELRQPQAERYINRAVQRWKTSRLLTRNLNEIPRIHKPHHLPTETSDRATSFDRNNPNRFSAQNSFNKERAASNINHNEIVITTQPFTSTGFQSSVSELLRQSSIHSVQPVSIPLDEPHSVEPLLNPSVQIDSGHSYKPGSIRSVRPGSIRSVQPGSVRSNQPGSIRSIPRGSILSAQPGSNRSVSSGHRPKLNDIFYDGCGPSPVASISGSVRSSSSVRDSPRRPPLPTNLDRSNSLRTGGRMGVGVVRGAAEQESGNNVVTYQPRRSAAPITSSDEAGSSCCSGCSRCF